MKLPLCYYGNPVLRKKAKPILEITPEILTLAKDMIETMEAHKGLGLAAPQVGKLLRIFVCRDEIVREGKCYFGPPQVILNPEISHPSKEVHTQEEGCLSIPGCYVEVTRPVKIRLRYQNLQGEWIEEERKELIARISMHENDHLNGVLHIDRTSEKEKKRVEAYLRLLKKRSLND